jgi:hypothetical protein
VAINLKSTLVNLLLFVIAPFQMYSQTTIILAKFDSGFCIGMDSRRAVFSDAGPVRFDTVCKIQKVNNIYIVSAGVSSPEFRQKASDFARQKRNCGDAANFFKIWAVKARQKFIDSLSEEHSGLLKNHLDELKKLDYTFIGFENDTPVFYTVEFTMKSINRHQTVECVIIKNIEPTKGVVFLFLGHYEHLQSQMSKKDFGKGLPLEVVIEKLISIECTAVPEAVAKPINLIWVYKNQYKWVRNPVKCKF